MDTFTTCWMDKSLVWSQNCRSIKLVLAGCGAFHFFFFFVNKCVCIYSFSRSWTGLFISSWVGAAYTLELTEWSINMGRLSMNHNIGVAVIGWILVTSYCLVSWTSAEEPFLLIRLKVVDDEGSVATKQTSTYRSITLLKGMTSGYTRHWCYHLNKVLCSKVAAVNIYELIELCMLKNRKQK